MQSSRQGLLFGIAAYGMWGAFPLYFPLLEPAGPFEILAHRVFWSAVTTVLLVVAIRRGPRLLAILRQRRKLLLLVVASVTISTNWAMYIWAVNNEHVVEASLGYFINPLITVLIGVLILGERLRRGQWIALSITGIATLVLTLDYGHPPWISLVLACSFGTYGLAKKQANVGALESLAIEAMLVSPIGLLYVGFLSQQGESTLTTEGTGHVLLLVSTGIVTAVPLVCFGAAATRIPLVQLGMLQYLTPSLQFSLGVFLLGEEMPTARWIGFALVWVALVVLTLEGWRNYRVHLRTAALSSAAE